MFFINAVMNAINFVYSGVDVYILFALINILLFINIEKYIYHNKVIDINNNAWFMILLTGIVIPYGWIMYISVVLDIVILNTDYYDFNMKRISNFLCRER